MSLPSFALLLCFAAVNSFEVVPRSFIELSTQERLPAAFVANWPTWILELNCGSLTKIPDSDGFVDPTSIDELWQPVDLVLPTAKLALGLHIRNGVVRHVMPALDLSLDGLHRNRGLCSVPRAHTWVDFAAATWQQSQLVASQRKQGLEEWSHVCTSPIGAIDEAVLQIPQISDSLPGDGSHLVHIPLEKNFSGLKTGIEIRVQLMNKGQELAVLQVAVTPTAAGSESDYLPDAYRSLFEDETFRRQAYVEMLKRKRST